MSTLTQALLVLGLILAAAFFVAAEIALVSLRDGQVRALAQKGRRGRAVERLIADPNRFLAAVQVGITLFGLLSSAVGAVSLSKTLGRKLSGELGWSTGVADGVALVVVTILISYFSLVLGELAPKRLAIQRNERVALLTAPALDRVATWSRPVIWLLGKSANVVVRAFGGDPDAGSGAITEEELRGVVATHEALDPDERRLIDRVFALGERQVREVMVPRTEVDLLDASDSVSRAIRMTSTAPHSRYPVVRGGADEVVGFVHVRDLVTAAGRRTAKVGELAREVKTLPATKRVLPAMAEMRREGHHLAIVVDEYGGTAGIVTLEDLIEEVVGDIRDEYDADEIHTRTLRGGDVEVDGLLNLEDFCTETGVELPDGPYETVGGFLMARLGHVPRAGEAVEASGVRLKVSGMDGRRVQRVRVTVVDQPDQRGQDD